MSRSLQSCSWRTNLLLCLGLFLHCGEAKVHTEVQAGPLYRVVGTPLSISCNVSGFINPNAKQEFEFRVKKPANPMFEINIISTGDNDFGYAVYLDRVRTKEITLTHVSPTAVVFEIQSLQKNDEGEFECSVKNSENVYLGTYSAQTVVKVIDNSLSVSSPSSTSLSYDEGDALTLTCQASSNTVQHTHLSIAWYLRKDGEGDPRPIISLDRDFTLSPGPGFEGRYQAGLVRLDKIGEATYRLKMDKLEVSDQGQIYCQAREWIQDPDRSWYAITQADAAETTLIVRARVLPDTSSVAVRISAQPATLQEGQELSLSCNIDTEKLEERFFSVAWRKGGVELARIGPTGILSLGPEYSVRGKEGELRAARVGSKDYRLILQPVRTEDHGEYVCRAWPQDRGQDGAFTQGAAQDSSSQLVSISAAESGLSLEMQNSVTVNERDKLVLTCKVHGVNGQLSVTWQHKATSAAIFTNVISLSQEGVMETAGEFSRRRVRATRPATDTFTLELDEVTPSDAGVYQCAVSEWKTNSKTNSRSQTATVTVAPVESYVKVNLISRNSIVTVGDDVALMCRVKGPHVPITLTWSLQRDATNLDNILTLNYDGAVSWSAGVEQSYQLKVENTASEVRHHLLIHGASQREAGSYQCSASVFIENAYKRLPASNQLAVKVNKPVSKLDLSSAPALTSNIDTDIEIKCSVISKTTASSHYAVTWLLQQQAEKQIFISSDRDALLTFGPQVEPSHRQRISMKRTKGPSFELSIRQAQISDGGSYTCEVVEWLQDPRGDWYELSPVSRTTNVTVLEPENNLSIEKNELELNRSLSQDFTIPCHITSRSSNDSEFQVTWFWQEVAETKQLPIFIAYRDATLHDSSGMGDRLRFRHPLPNQFSLTVTKLDLGDSGLYFCEVEEWIPSLPHGWRKVAVEKSGNLTVYVNAEGDARAVTEPACNSGIYIAILVAFALCALVVIVVLLLKICRSNGAKKSEKSLWTEQVALNSKPGAED
ncbi:immunoglobulin superfamily member 2-like [Acanthopagrus latus]|uniref:immunoglobulin superfamily member 2-like n=1 Tax=Acanthopagrus latus TaxID=8177 RepID=UPI00187C3B93|nr:immunoglobulin superfamily member 2-like [Acanthopagrus latus]XP_036964952.1 immunoglobulin superfamily member 2-like [Acanthopagrus latus]